MLGPATTGLFYIPNVQYYLILFAVLCRNLFYLGQSKLIQAGSFDQHHPGRISNHQKATDGIQTLKANSCLPKETPCSFMHAEYLCPAKNADGEYVS